MSALADLERKYIAALEQIKQLTADNAILTARVEELSQIPDVPARLRLSKTERLFFLRLLTGGLATKESLMAEVYADRWGTDDEPETKIVDVYICKLRKKLAPLGIVIETVQGTGYLMPEESKRLIRRMNRETLRSAA